jgi:hypothetical protein
MHLHHHAQTLLLVVHQLLQAARRQAETQHYEEGVVALSSINMQPCHPMQTWNSCQTRGDSCDSCRLEILTMLAAGAEAPLAIKRRTRSMSVEEAAGSHCNHITWNQDAL